MKEGKNWGEFEKYKCKLKDKCDKFANAINANL